MKYNENPLKEKQFFESEVFKLWFLDKIKTTKYVFGGDGGTCNSMLSSWHWLYLEPVIFS